MPYESSSSQESVPERVMVSGAVCVGSNPAEGAAAMWALTRESVLVSGLWC